MAKTTQLQPSALPGQGYGTFLPRVGLAFDAPLSAMAEQVGGSVLRVIDAPYRLRLPYGYGGARFYVLAPIAFGLVVTLPRADYCSVGGLPVTVTNPGPLDFQVANADGEGLVTVGPGEGASFRLLSNATAAGVWLVRLIRGVAFGTEQVDRVPVEIRLTESSSAGFKLRQRVLAMLAPQRVAELGFPPDAPFDVRCTIAAGVVIGSDLTTQPAFDTEDGWPAGSGLVLALESGAIIAGKGGRGGRGGDVPPGLLPQPGTAGGIGFRMYLPTALVSAGTIQGGGGGGGAGGYSGTTPGAGGGGGAGYAGGAGGASGNRAGGLGPYPGGAGQPGSIAEPGSGGYTPASAGSYGGLPGAVGNGIDGGAAGKAIAKPAGHVLTKIRAGTIVGVEDP